MEQREQNATTKEYGIWYDTDTQIEIKDQTKLLNRI